MDNFKCAERLELHILEDIIHAARYRSLIRNSKVQFSRSSKMKLDGTTYVNISLSANHSIQVFSSLYSMISSFLLTFCLLDHYKLRTHLCLSQFAPCFFLFSFKLSCKILRTFSIDNGRTPFIIFCFSYPHIMERT